MSKRKNILPACDNLETKPKVTKSDEDDVDCSVQTVRVVEPNKSVAVGRDVCKPDNKKLSTSTFIFKKPVHISSARKMRKGEILTRDALRKDCRKGSDDRFNFAADGILKRNKLRLSATTPVVKNESKSLKSMQDDHKDADATFNSDWHLEILLGSPDDQPSIESSKVSTSNSGSGIVSSLSDMDMYIHLLITNHEIVPCDHSFKEFVVQEFSHTTLSLKPYSYVFVTRSGRQFEDRKHWLYTCTCNSDNSRLLNSLSAKINCDYAKFSEDFPHCIHIIAATHILTEVDAVHCITPDLDFEDHSYASMNIDSVMHVTDSIIQVGNCGAICLNVEETFGVKYISASTIITCATCRYSKTSCKHILSLFQILSDVTDHEDIPKALLPIFQVYCQHNEDKILPRQSAPSLSCMSKDKIPFDLTTNLSSILLMPSSSRFNIVDGISMLIPETTAVCNRCGLISWSEDLCLFTGAHIVTMNCFVQAKVFYLKCNTEDCEGCLHYDGQKMCLLNMKTLLFTYEVLRQFMFHFLLGRTTIYTEYTVLNQSYIDAGNSNFKDVVHYTHFCSAWYAYLELLDIDYSCGFQCSNCGPYPSLVVMDATALSFRRQFDFWSNIFTRHQEIDKVIIPKGSFSDRILISDSKMRHLILKYIKSGLTDEEIADLFRYCHSKCTFLMKLMNHLESLSTPQRLTSKLHQCPSLWRNFIHSIGSSSAVCALIPPNEKSIALINQLCDEDILTNPERMKQLQETTPVLFDLIFVLGHYPSIITPILKEMIIKSQVPFSVVPSTDDDINLSESGVLYDDEIKNLCYFPTLPLICRRRNYEADSSKRTIVCTKQNAGHPSLLPGVFTLFCHHGICYGFQAMRVRESPDTPFTLLYERCIEAPETIVYDNCCNLHNYCLNREPDFFRNSQFLVDCFHWSNHIGCSCGYNLATYPQFSCINTQVVEQANSTLSRIKSSLSYMNAKNFMRHCKLYLWYRNRCKKLGNS